MNSKFIVTQVGLGAIGKRIVEQLHYRDNISIQDVIDINPNLIDKHLNDIIDSIDDSNIIITSDLQKALNQNPADVVIILTASSLEKVAPLIKIALEMGSNVISICEELSFPFQKYPDLSHELDNLAKANNVSIIGTGINPGFLMDLLPIILTAPCQKVDKIQVKRVINSAKRRNPFQAKIGTGLSLKEFEQKISNKEITGHVGLVQSIQMINDALGFKPEEIKDYPPEAILAENNITTSYCSIPQGHVCGLKSKAIAKLSGINVIELEFIAYAGDHREYDSIHIDGIPKIKQKIEGGIHGDYGTVAMVINLIPIIYKATPGLLTMKDIIIPRNTAKLFKK